MIVNFKKTDNVTWVISRISLKTEKGCQITCNLQRTTVVWDSDSWMGQLPKPLYNCQNVTQMNMLLHFSPKHTSCEFHDILTTLLYSFQSIDAMLPINCYLFRKFIFDMYLYYWLLCQNICKYVSLLIR